MATIELRNVCKIYENTKKKKEGVLAVQDFSMKIENGEFIVFVGPSGCGKSTTLRMIAGLEEISSGELIIDGEYMNDTEPKNRNLAMVFQNYALYPFLTVYENIAFGLKLRKIPKNEIDEKVHTAAKMLDIEDYLERKPKALSGGQRQRVALGRALVREANAYLLDEPLSNLDAKLRGAMRVEIVDLWRKLNKTFIYVTHDQVEAMTMGTRIVVMNKGLIQQIDTPVNLYDHPVNKFVAGFIGTPQMNFFDGELTIKDGKASIDLSFLKGMDASEISLNPEMVHDGTQKICFGIRTEDCVITENGKIDATVEILEMLGSESLVHARTTDNQKIIIKMTERLNLRNGDAIKIDFNLNKCHLFDSETEKSIR